MNSQNLVGTKFGRSTSSKCSSYSNKKWQNNGSTLFDRSSYIIHWKMYKCSHMQAQTLQSTNQWKWCIRLQSASTDDVLFSTDVPFVCRLKTIIIQLSLRLHFHKLDMWVCVQMYICSMNVHLCIYSIMLCLLYLRFVSNQLNSTLLICLCARCTYHFWDTNCAEMQWYTQYWCSNNNRTFRKATSIWFHDFTTTKNYHQFTIRI